MSRAYTIAQGDDLTTIAKRFAFNDWRTIYYDGSNAAFRERRPDPFVLFPGDVINIPDKQPRREEAATGARHKFYVHGMTRVLRLRLLDPFGAPLAKEPYQLFLGGRLVRSDKSTDGDGLLTEDVPVDARDAKVTTRDFSWDLDIGDLNPMDRTDDGGVSGAQGRLLNLGYPVGKVDGKLGPKTAAALRMFQRDKNLSQTKGELDDETKKALIAAYGM
jgi:N-acetylmuramoyl-L-alanine amidase